MQDAPRVDPNLLSHPYDRRTMIEAMRKLLEYLEAPVFKKNTVKMIGYPASKSEQDIWVCKQAPIIEISLTSCRIIARACVLTNNPYLISDCP
jgi:hypothetical protein